MAPVYDFRHVELDKIGRGKRIIKPPGGECSDIFGPDSPGLSTPRKSNNHMQSTIFSPNGSTSPTNGYSTPCKKSEDTQGNLFGANFENGTSRKVVDRFKSNIFEDEVDSGIISPKSTPVRKPSLNPITGTQVGQNGSTNGTNGTNGYNGVMEQNGYMNGTTNGHSHVESPSSRGARTPPGGHSSGIF